MVVIHCVRLNALPCLRGCVLREGERRVCCAGGCRVTESTRAVLRAAVLCWPKGSVVPPCFVDRQWQARAANQQPRSRLHSPLPFLVKATCLPLLTIVYVYVWCCKGRCNRERSQKAKIASVWGKRCRMRCRGGSNRRAVSEGQAAHCAATAAHQAGVARGRFSGGLQPLHLLQLRQSFMSAFSLQVELELYILMSNTPMAMAFAVWPVFEPVE